MNLPLLDVMLQQAYDERMAQVEAHDDLVSMAHQALDDGDEATALQAWLIAGNSGVDLIALMDW